MRQKSSHIGAIKLRVFDDFGDVRAAAHGALDGTQQPGPFDRIDWFEALHASAFAAQTPCILHASASNGAQGWLFLAAQEDGTLAGLSNYYSFHFRPQFVDAPDRATRQALLASLARGLHGRAHQLSCYPLVDDGAMDADAIANGFRAGGWRTVLRTMGMKRRVDLPLEGSFADYWALRPGRLRATYKRKAHSHPLAIAIHDQIDDIRWAALETVFAASWRPRGGDDFAFLRAFAQREAMAGRLRMGLAHAGDQPVAVELWTIDQGTAYIHKLAFAESHAKASPGTQLSYAMFRYAIEDAHVRSIDFGTGDNGYKANWMPQTLPMRQMDAFDLRAPAAWRPYLKAWLSALWPAPDSAQPARNGKADGRRQALGAAGRFRK